MSPSTASPAHNLAALRANVKPPLSSAHASFLQWHKQLKRGALGAGITSVEYFAKCPFDLAEGGILATAESELQRLRETLAAQSPIAPPASLTTHVMSNTTAQDASSVAPEPSLNFATGTQPGSSTVVDDADDAMAPSHVPVEALSPTSKNRPNRPLRPRRR
jgi:hypothetical protein